MTICERIGCYQPASRVINGRNFCATHRTTSEAPPVKCSVRGFALPALPGAMGYGLCGYHLHEAPPPAAA